jgi:hypothetical protein
MLLLTEVFYGSLQLGLRYSLLLDLLLHDLGSLHDFPSPDHLFLYQSKALIFLAKARQLILNDSFDFLLRILHGIF